MIKRHYHPDWLSVWCVAFFVDFGSINIPKDLNIPPSLRMLGIEPQTKLNCEILDPSKGFEVRWAIAGRSIVTQLVAKYVIHPLKGLTPLYIPININFSDSTMASTWLLACPETIASPS